MRLAATERRDQLLAAAAAHIDTYGLEFSLDDVARRAGISPPLMRHYFKNRDGLLIALLAQGIDAIMAILAEGAGGDLRARLGAYLSYVRERPWAHRLWRAAVLNDDALAPLVHDARERLVRAAFGADVEALDDAQRFLGEAWIAVVESAVDRWLAAGATDRGGLVTDLLDVARRLGVPRA